MTAKEIFINLFAIVMIMALWWPPLWRGVSGRIADMIERNSEPRGNVLTTAKHRKANFFN